MNLYDRIELDVLLDAIKKASLQIFSEKANVIINKNNSLIGINDYESHQHDDIRIAREILNVKTGSESYISCKQNLNYYRDGKMFDVILYSGYRGGYRFHIGWTVDKEQTLTDNGKEFNELMTAHF